MLWARLAADGPGPQAVLSGKPGSWAVRSVPERSGGPLCLSLPPGWAWPTESSLLRDRGALNAGASKGTITEYIRYLSVVRQDSSILCSHTPGRAAGW